MILIMRWIPISKKLPSESGVYMVQYKGMNMPDITTYYKHNEPDDDRWATDSGRPNRTNDDIEAWMPLPEPFRGDDY